MSKVKLLLDVIEDIRSLGDSLQVLADAMAGGNIAEQPKTKAKPAPKAEQKAITLEDVRKVLAEKSRAGFTNEVKAIITAHGSDKLSDINPAEYESVLKEAEVIGNA